MFRTLLLTATLSASAVMLGCATSVQHSNECLDCEPKVEKVKYQTQYVPTCPKKVEVLHYLPGCSSCAYPVTVRSQAENCLGTAR